MINRAPVPAGTRRITPASPTTAGILWAGGLDTSQIFVFDVGSNPPSPSS